MSTIIPTDTASSWDRVTRMAQHYRIRFCRTTGKFWCFFYHNCQCEKLNFFRGHIGSCCQLSTRCWHWLTVFADGWEAIAVCLLLCLLHLSIERWLNWVDMTDWLLYYRCSDVGSKHVSFLCTLFVCFLNILHVSEIILIFFVYFSFQCFTM